MKYFTDPTGRFVIKIPIEWQYQNIAIGFEETSPFSFQFYENPIGAFQISCYSEHEKPLNKNVKVQKFDTPKLEFHINRMDKGEFNMHLWYAVVEDCMLMAKYIYTKDRENDAEIKIELEKVETALSTLELLSPDKRPIALELDKYEKFMASLAASFDLKIKAIESSSLIELLIIIANQIDAYLRIAIVMKLQLENKSDRINTAFLFQSKNDRPIMEREIYKKAVELGIINQITFTTLENLYKERNKVVHRYIITEFKTRNLYNIIHEYEIVCEIVRNSLKEIEDLQYKEGIGIHGNSRNPNDEPKEIDKQIIFSQVNDKHLIKELYRQIDPLGNK